MTGVYWPVKLCEYTLDHLGIVLYSEQACLRKQGSVMRPFHERAEGYRMI